MGSYKDKTIIIDTYLDYYCGFCAFHNSCASGMVTSVKRGREYKKTQ